MRAGQHRLSNAQASNAGSQSSLCNLRVLQDFPLNLQRIVGDEA
jgi:hypothetical protein